MTENNQRQLFNEWKKQREESGNKTQDPSAVIASPNETAKPSNKIDISLNKSDYAIPDGYPIAFDEVGQPYYTELPPDLEGEGTIYYKDFTKHIPFLYFSPPVDGTMQTKSYVNLYKGAKFGPQLQFGDEQSPVRVPFGATIYKGKKDKNSKKDEKPEKEADKNKQPSLLLAIETPEFKELAQALDKKCTSMALAKKDTWPCTGDKDEDMLKKGWGYVKTYKEVKSKDKAKQNTGYPPLFTFTTHISLSGSKATEVWLKLGEKEDGSWKCIEVPAEKVTIDLFPPGMYCIPTVDIASIWFMADKFGVQAYCNRIIIVPPKNKRKADFVKMGNMEIIPKEEFSEDYLTQFVSASKKLKEDSGKQEESD